MTDHESVLRRMREANPVSSLDGLREEDLAAVRTLLERKRGGAPSAPAVARERRWRRAALVTAAAFTVTLVGFGTALLLLRGDEGAPVVAVVTTTTTTQATTTQATTTTTLEPGKVPAASMEELVIRTFAALTEGDGAALHRLFVHNDQHLIFVVLGDVGSPGGLVNNATYQPSNQTWEVLGKVMVSGDVAVVPVRATYPAAAGPEVEGVWVGFDVMVGKRAGGGFLGVGGTCLYARVDAAGYAEADPAAVEELLAAQAAAWAAGDIDGVLAGYWSGWDAARYLDGLTHRGPDRVELADFYAGMRLEFTGDPVISGTFVAVATRVTDLASGVSTDGFSVYWINEGLIQLHVLTTGE